MSNNLIRGAGGGGGKDGGGGASHTHYEAPDSLQSIEYARVIDVIGEGEIGGLAKGLQGVYLNDTPVQNADGSFNFTNCSFTVKTGTPFQASVPGFPAAETETNISTQLRYGLPIVRRISDTTVNAVRVTVGIPSLMSQDTSNGDVKGASVQLAIDVNNNGAGWVPVTVGTENISLGTGASLYSDRALTQATLNVSWTGVITYSGSLQKVSWAIESSLDGVVWSAAKAGSFSGYTTVTSDDSGTTSKAPTASDGVVISLSGVSGYRFRVRLVSGGGTLSLFGTAVAYTPTITISGKCTSRYQRSFRVPLSGSGPWDIRLRRLNADSTSTALSNQTWWDSMTEITDYRLAYPNTAYIAINIDAKQFSSIPTRKYLVDLLKIQVPSNYDPENRVYTGDWDGTFKTSVSSNPAWCFYDLMTQSRYGLGRYIPPALQDKWLLYAIGRYCDELVPDGFGGYEPRYSLNVWINEPQSAYDLLQSLVGTFRGMIYAAGGSLSPVADMPGSPKMIYSAANVIGGNFTYQGAPRSQRHSVVNVTWKNPENLYQDEVESVPDDEAIKRYGIRKLEITGFGCTSRGLAHRLGRWALYSERYGNTVTFQTGLDKTAFLRPGDLIEIADGPRAGARMAGRIRSATESHVELDAPVTLTAGVSYALRVLTPEGEWTTAAIVPTDGEVSSVDLVSPLESAPLVGSMWGIQSDALSLWPARVVSIKESAKNIFELTALEYNASKYDAIEKGLVLQKPIMTQIPSGAPASPSNIDLVESLYEDKSSVKSRITVSWVSSAYARQYRVSWRRDNGNWLSTTTESVSVDINDTAPGKYEIQVVAIDALGRASQALPGTIEAMGLIAAPSELFGLDLSAINGLAMLTWPLSVDLDVRIGGTIRIKHSPDEFATWENATDIGSPIPGSATQVVLPLLSGTYLAKAVDSSGVESATAVSVSTNAPAVMAFNAVARLQESPVFPGAVSRCAAVDNRLKLSSATDMDSWADLDSILNWDAGEGLAPEGIYDFSDIVDLGTIDTCRVTGYLQAESYLAYDLMDLWTDIDSRQTWDGTVSGLTSAEIQISTTESDPEDENGWGDWSTLRVGDYKARAFRFRAVLRSSDPSAAIDLTGLWVSVDMPDRVVVMSDVPVPQPGLQVNFSPQFRETPAVGVTAQGLQPGEYVEVSARSKAGFFVSIKNASGDPVSGRSIDVIAKGWGYVAA